MQPLCTAQYASHATSMTPSPVKSWDHAITPLGVDPDTPITSINNCSLCPPAHKLLATYLATYTYVGGRSGNIKTSRRRMCATHAAQYCHTHALPPLVPPNASSKSEVV
jgi:hypothetical protein